jgi:hypothetical protein
MRVVDSIILAVVDGEFVEVEFWRNKPVGYKTYDATPKRVASVIDALRNTGIFYSKLDFHRKDMTIHIEV